jgi:hypothetical protein
MSDTTRRRSKPTFTFAAEYTPDRERMLHALLRILGKPEAEVNRLLAEGWRERSETAPQTTEKKGDKTSKREGFSEV